MALCRSLPGVTEDVKWGDNLVFSVAKKMFAVFDLPEGEPFSVKVEDGAFEVLTGLPGIRPAPYLARHRWISFDDPGVLEPAQVEDLVRHSYQLVAAKLPLRTQRELGLADAGGD